MLLITARYPESQAISGWSRGSAVADCEAYQVPAGETLFLEPAASQKGGGRAAHVANVAIASATDQIAYRRHPARDQRQFPRAVRLLPVRLLRQTDRRRLLSSRERDR